MRRNRMPAISFVHIALLCLACNAVAQDTRMIGAPVPTLDYARLYVDAEGVSHFDDGTLMLSVQNYAPPANPIAIHAFENLDSATFVFLPQGAAEDWHPAPRRQFAIITQGTVEVTAGDGEARRFGPGDIVLLEDTTGTGHQTRVIGDQGNLSIMVAAGNG